MRVFYGENAWYGKVNFVDDNNVLLGFENTDDCCARGGWFLADKKDEWKEDGFKEEAMDLPGWVFDPAYFVEAHHCNNDEGGSVQFRLVNGENEKFLTLYNHHNGYYSRGFEFHKDGNATREGTV